MNSIPRRLTPEDIIARAEQEQERFVAEAMRQYHRAEYMREERKRLWKGIFVALAITATTAGFLFWMVR